MTRFLYVLLILPTLALSLAAPMAAAGQSSPVADTHVHLRNGEQSLREYEDQVAAAGLDIDLIGAMWFGGPNQALADRLAEIRAGNDTVIALGARHPELVPIATVHPYDGPQAIAELERVAGAGVGVLKIHPHTQKFDLDDPRVRTLARRAGELGVIVMIDNANILPGDSEKLFNLALDVPGTKFIFAHMGATNFRFWNVLKAARTAENLFGENIYFDISATVALFADSPVEEELVWTMRNVGIEHLLLGSDYPQYTLEQNVRALEALGLDEGEVAMIRYENARALFVDGQ